VADKIHNVFISHIHEDDAGLQKLKDLLGSHGRQLRDASIDSSSPNNAKSHDYIKYSVLAPQIDWAGTFLVYITPGTKNSEWVNWEIEYAESCGKRIVGVWAHGHSDCEIPEALNKYADAIVGWNGSQIIDAIDGKIDGWEKSDGSPFPQRPIKRHGC
jgi:MTH538 TIR-like domain (DUF1863)